MGRGQSQAGTAVADRRRRPKSSAPTFDPGFQASNEEILFYAYGQCHALAAALHKQTGWPLMGCGWHKVLVSKAKWNDKKIPDHIFVVCPDGLGLDICGKYSRGQHPEADMGDDWQEMTLAEVKRLEKWDFDVMETGRAKYTASQMLGLQS